jgi:hypothetical protein
MTTGTSRAQDSSAREQLGAPIADPSDPSLDEWCSFHRSRSTVACDTE